MEATPSTVPSARWGTATSGNVHWFCCGGPLQACACLHALTEAVPQQTAREPGLWHFGRPTARPTGAGSGSRTWADARWVAVRGVLPGPGWGGRVVWLWGVFR
ncbi:hypothetical protein GCM10010245_83880 [Streptomyces spectabilis]|nr:hypothetical protein GCM10010245_83880 [Streptomyces spectabilis]